MKKAIIALMICSYVIASCVKTNVAPTLRPMNPKAPDKVMDTIMYVSKA